MAPINRIILASALAALVAARPLNVGRAPAPAQVTETAWTTIDVPVTLWVDENGTPLSTVAGDQIIAASTPTTTTPAAVIPTSTTTTTIAVTESPAAPVAPAPTSLSITTTITAASWVPSDTNSFVAKQVSTAAPAATPAAASGGDTVVASDSATCEGTGNACSGDITHWDGGLGACGWNVNTGSDMQIALPVGLMGAQSNGNPYCGRSLTVKNPTTGQTVQATVGDKCMGCVGRSIDLTNALFAAVGGGCDGRCSGFQWWFN